MRENEVVSAQGLPGVVDRVKQMAGDAIRPFVVDDAVGERKVFIDPRTFETAEVNLPTLPPGEVRFYREPEAFVSDYLSCLERKEKVTSVFWNREAFNDDSHFAVFLTDFNNDYRQRHIIRLIIARSKTMNCVDELNMSSDGFTPLYLAKMIHERMADCATRSSEQFVEVMRSTNFKQIREEQNRMTEAEIAAGVSKEGRLTSSLGKIPDSFTLMIKPLLYPLESNRYEFKVRVIVDAESGRIKTVIDETEYERLVDSACREFLAPVFELRKKGVLVAEGVFIETK